MGHPDLKYGDSGHARGAVQNDGAGRVVAKKAWIVAVAAAVLVCVSAFVARDVSLRGAQQAALVSEAVDEHIAAIAAAGPEVVSSDRHTVKPWFQGKLPFSFNLPQALPVDVTLDGANLVQVEGHAAAQLLFSIGKHRASVFVRQDNGDFNAPMHLFYRMHARFRPLQAEHNGFRVEGFVTRGGLEFDAVSDADPARLGELVRAIEQAQE